jgi:hypothetical protein
VTFIAPRVAGQIFAVLTFVLVFVALCLKQSVAEKGVRLTGE